MELNLKIGLAAEKSEQVTDDRTAVSFGSGSVAVYATPAMACLIEGACLEAVAAALPQGLTTVGTELCIKHLAATPVGMQVRAKGELVNIEGKRLTFAVEAFDEKEQIGAGTHERFVIQSERFLQKAEAKR